MKREEIYRECLEYVKKEYSKYKEMGNIQELKGIYDIEYRKCHIKRVVSISRKLAKEEGVEDKLVTIASILHDISKFEVEYNKIEDRDHAIVGSERVREYLNGKMFEYELSEEEVLIISNAIKYHSIGKDEICEEIVNGNIELKLLIDADSLDKVGIMTLLRNVTNFNNASNETIDYKDLYNKVVKKKEKVVDFIYSESAKKELEKRMEELRNVIEYLENDLDEFEI